MTLKVPSNPWLLSGLCAVFLSLGWYFAGGGLTLLLGFVPLLLIEKNIRDQKSKFAGLKIWLWAYFSFFLWNLFTTWWVAIASIGGAIGMLVANTLLMSWVFILYSFTKKRLGNRWGMVSFIAYWLLFEYIHLNWELNWTWLLLGNGFAYSYQWVQWYEVTGTLGGSLWVLLVNVLVLQVLSTRNKPLLWTTASLVIAPITISYIIYFSYTPKGAPFEAIVVQPNIDPYQEKFRNSPNFIPFDKQIERFLMLSEKLVTPQTRLIALPETSIDGNFDEKFIEQAMHMKQFSDFTKKYPNVSLITGATTLTIYPYKATYTASFSKEVNVYYDNFNTALFFDPQVDSIAIYHKSKLVPGVELFPYPQVFNFLQNMMIDLGGTSGGYGWQKEREVFFQDSIGVAPIICYESVFGGYVTEYVRKGANILCIITNDGWWNNTPGHRQHLRFASLRAIETRKDIARSANTGISGFINQRGDISQATKYWEMDVRKATLLTNDIKTFYVRFGDYIGRLALLCSFLLWIGLGLSFIVKRKIS